MKHLKLYENFENPNFLLNIVKKQALQYNKPEVLAMVIDKGFDLESNKLELINYCKNKGLHDSVKMIDPNYHQKLVEQTTSLNLDNRELKVLQLNTLINLTGLVCSNNNLTDLKGIEEITNLEHLVCYENNLTNLKGIEFLINLEHLSCYDNDLTDLKGVESLTDLKDLYCGGNNLTDLKGIESLTNLKDLYCHDNDFSSELEAFGNDISKWQEYHRND